MLSDRAKCSVANAYYVSIQISEVLKYASNFPTRSEFANVDIEGIKYLDAIQEKLQELEPRLLVTDNRIDVIEEKINKLNMTSRSSKGNL